MRGAGGFRGGSGFRGGVVRNGAFRRNFVFRGVRGYYGYGWPYYYTGFYGGYCDPYYSDCGYVDPYYNGSASYGYADSAYAPPAPDPPVIVEQTPPALTVHEYIAPAQAPEAQQYGEPLYLLAMRDGSIRAVLSYSADGTSLHYVTLDHEQKQVPLSSLDRVLSERLNRERHVPFKLPG
jgi:hypothetical protein